ncbi:hypothetical protein [Salinactinospora qingdaonensis]|uniref:Uncharacterized protein n=1 Tax=Salinactinospora qingdaonensis TaxID=702744 RepID=A0ABP7GFW0_9ACTN
MQRSITPHPRSGLTGLGLALAAGSIGWFATGEMTLGLAFAGLGALILSYIWAISTATGTSREHKAATTEDADPYNDDAFPVTRMGIGSASMWMAFWHRDIPGPAMPQEEWDDQHNRRGDNPA